MYMTLTTTTEQLAVMPTLADVDVEMALGVVCPTAWAAANSR